MVRRITRAAAVAGLVTSSLLAGCSASAAPPPSSISADLSEFKVTLDSNRAQAGKVSFAVRNGGTIVHEFVVLKTDLATDKLATKDGELDEDSPDVARVDEVEDVTPGSTKTLTVTLEPGSYVLICNLPGHFLGGMRATLEVPASTT